MFAAIYIPDFPVEAMVRAEPELREQAVAVMEGTPPLVHVIALNERAAQAGIEPGMTKLQAEAMVDSQPSVASSDSRVASRAQKQSAIRFRSPEREAAAHAALLDCACGFSPRVEDTAPDTVVLDLAGLERIFGAPAKIARDVARRCSEMGMEANVAVASNPDTAVLAARGFAGVTVIAEGKEAERLGELSVEVLTESMVDGRWPMAFPVPGIAKENQKSKIANHQCVEILETLERWGVRNLRAMAALPEVALAERLGQEGLFLQKLARGQTRRALVIAEPPLVFEEAVELEYPLETLEPLAFVLNRMLEQLCTRLAARALATNELTVRLDLELERDCRIGELTDCRIPDDTGGNCNSTILKSDNSSIFERSLRLPVPMLDAKVFLKLLQLDLQAHPPLAPVTKIWLRAEPAQPRRTQNGLFVPEAPEAERLELTIARIEKVVGGSSELRVASSEGEPEKNCRLPIADCPDGSRQNRESEINNRQCGFATRVGSPEILDTHRADGFRMRRFGADATVARVSDPGTRVKDSRHTLTALRVFRPPLAAVVTLREGCPAHLASPERPTMRGDVVWCAGPWRSSGEWWTEQAWSRAEWDVAVRNEEGVTLYRIVRDEIGGKWWVEGTYD